jgi:hypothetical protein
VKRSAAHTFSGIRLLCGLFAQLLAFWSCPQSISRTDALADLRFLNDAVRNGHPVNYRTPGKISLDSFVGALVASPADSLSYTAYRTFLGSALQSVGCVHTSVSKNPLSEKLRPAGYFPLIAAHAGNGLYALSQVDSLSPLDGKQILSVNGISADSVLGIIFRYTGSDGGTQAFARELANRSMASFVSFACGYPSTYRIEMADTIVMLAASRKLPVASVVADSTLWLRTHGKNRFRIGAAYALLDINTFERSDKRFFRRCFRDLDGAGIPLIIDLRQNTGGNRRAAAELTRHLVPEKFDYRILRPKLLSPSLYLTGGQQLIYSLSRVKYAFGKKQRTAYGKATIYNYTPRRKHRFTGKIIVLTDGLTASSSTMVTSWLKQQTDAVFVGSQAAGGYDGNNGGAFPKIVLPASGIEVRFPAYRLVLDAGSEKADGIVPDHVVGPSIHDLLENRDPVMEKAAQLIPRP